MPSRNDVFFNKEVFTSVVHLENQMSPYFFFSRVLGGQGGAVDEMFEPAVHGTGLEFIKILEESHFQESARVMDVSRVPEILWAGKNFEITLDKAFADGDETLMFRDEETTFRVESRRAGTLGTDFTMQYIGIPGTFVHGSMIKVGDTFHDGYGNSKGEGSMDSNTLTDDMTKRTTFFNLMNIMRYGFAQTGSAAADELYQFAVEQATDGSKTDLVRTDIPVKIMRRVLRALDNALMHNKPNFNPRTKEIANRSSVGRYPERPYFAGIYWQLDQCPWKYRHSKHARVEDGVQKLDMILQYNYNRTGQKQTIFAMAEGAGLEWLREIIRVGGMKKYGVNVYQKVEGGQTLKIGFDADEYYTAHGRIVIYDINRAMGNWGEFDKTHYNGIAYKKRSNKIYFMPGSMRNTNGTPKKPSHIYFKEGNGISRAFSYGWMQGIGVDKGMSGSQLLSMQDDFIQRNMENERYRMNSTVDGREFHVLMEMTPYLDVRNVTRLELF